MPDEHEFPSTHWLHEASKIKPPSNGQSTARRSRSPFRRLQRIGRERPVLIEVKWLGGPNAHWLVRSRGVSQAVPGICTIEDLMSMVRNDWPKPNHANEAIEVKRRNRRDASGPEAAT